MGAAREHAGPALTDPKKDGLPGKDGPLGKRSVIIAGHRTSVSLEPEFWSALKDLAEVRRLSINQLIEQIDAGRTRNLSSAIRVFVLGQYREAPFEPPVSGSAAGS